MTEDKKPETCCVKVGPDNMPCGQPIVYRTEIGDPKISGWFHVMHPQGHMPVPASLIR